MRTLLFHVLFSFFILTVGTVQSNMPKPHELQEHIESAMPYGYSKLSKFLIGDIYEIALWQDATQFSTNQPFAITIEYLRTISKDQLVDKTIEALERLKAPFNPETFRRKLEELFPDVQEGDRITSYVKPNAEITFYFNGIKAGTVSNREFISYFPAIWLSPDSQEPEMRDQLLRLDRAQ